MQEERRGNMWPSLKQTLPVMPDKAVAKILPTQGKVLWVGPHSPRCIRGPHITGSRTTFPVVPPEWASFTYTIKSHIGQLY